MTSHDLFCSASAGLESPLNYATPITPDDEAVLPIITRAVHLGGGGNLTVTLKGGDTVTFENLAAGWHPLRVRQVHAVGTTATGIVGGW